MVLRFILFPPERFLPDEPNECIKGAAGSRRIPRVELGIPMLRRWDILAIAVKSN
jgi:hypothetical protein